MSAKPPGSSGEPHPLWKSPKSAYPNFIDVYYKSHSLIPEKEEEPLHGVRVAISRHLGNLIPGLEKDADAAGWRVGEASWYSKGSETTAWLLIPSVDADDKIVAVRGVSISVSAPWSISDAEAAMKRFDIQSAIVTLANDAPEGADVPYPLIPDSFDQDFVWVTRSPIDALILQKRKVSAVALATPVQTLGSEDGVRGLEALGVLSTQRARAGTVVIVDPEVKFDSAVSGAMLLCGLFEHVWKDEVLPRANSYSSLTERGLVNVLPRARHSLLTSVLSAVISSLMVVVWDWCLEYDTHQMRLKPSGHDGFPSGVARKPLALVAATALEALGDTTPWLVKPFVAARAVTDFHGPAKEGKTTFLLSMCAAVAQGTTFLGSECKQSAVIYVTEQTAGTIRKSAARADGIAADLHFLTIETTFGWDFADVVRFVRAECRRLNAKLVVFDTLGPIAGLWGESENASGTARHVYRTLRALSVAGIAVVVVRHSRKARGSIVETGAGSVAFSGEADQLVRFTKPTETSRLRTVEVVGRLSDSKTLTVRFRKRVWRKAKAAEVAAGQAGTRKAGEPEPIARNVVRRVLEHAGRDGATRVEIAALSMDIGGKREKLLSVYTVGKELAILVKTKEVVRDKSTTAEKAKHWLARLHVVPPPPGPNPVDSTLTHSPSSP